MKAKKGTVVVSAHRGMLRLQLPRHVFNGDQKYIYLGLPDTPINKKAAELQAQVIATDIAFDRFDRTLERYRQGQTESLLSLSELWAKYTFYKSKFLAHSTLEKEFKWVEAHIQKLPSQRIQDARQIRKYLMRSMTPGVAKKVWLYLGACCRWAEEEELITSNPFDNLPKISSGKKSSNINPFTKEERDLIIAAFEEDYYYAYYAPFVKFLFLTGCRTSEAIGLQWKHISPSISVITFSEPFVCGRRADRTKNRKIRKFPVNDSLRSLLVLARPAEFTPDRLVFPSPHGLPIDGHNFLNRPWKSIMNNLPIQYRSVYHTRHTFISLCLEAGIKVTQVAQWVGNSADTIWRHYAATISEATVPE